MAIIALLIVGSVMAWLFYLDSRPKE